MQSLQHLRAHCDCRCQGHADAEIRDRQAEVMFSFPLFIDWCSVTFGSNPPDNWKQAEKNSIMPTRQMTFPTVNIRQHFSVECYGALHNYTVAVMYDDRYPACAVHKDVSKSHFILYY